MAADTAKSERDNFYDRLREANLPPLWERLHALLPKQPTVKSKPTDTLVEATSDCAEADTANPAAINAERVNPCNIFFMFFPSPSSEILCLRHKGKAQLSLSTLPLLPFQ